MTPGLATLGRPPWDRVVWRPGTPVVVSPWIPGLPAELLWFCSPGEPLVGAVPKEEEEDKETKINANHFQSIQRDNWQCSKTQKKIKKNLNNTIITQVSPQLISSEWSLQSG